MCQVIEMAMAVPAFGKVCLIILFCGCSLKLQHTKGPTAQTFKIVYILPIGLSSVYHHYQVTTQLIGSNILRRKEIPQINF
jgi:hypothetical protein